MAAASAHSTAVPLGAAVPSLVRWGLSVDADLVFRTLVTFGPRSEQVLAAELGLSRQRTADAVGELRAAGAAASALDGGGTVSRRTQIWTHLPPADVIAGLRSNRLRLVDPHTQARTHRGLVRTLVDRLGGVGVTISPATAAGLTGERIRLLPTRELTRIRVRELGRSERFDRMVINTEQVFDAQTRVSGTERTRSVVARGIPIRVLGVPPADGDLYQPGEELVNQTTFQYREAPAVPIKLFLLNRRHALFPIDPLDFERGYLEVTDRALVESLVMVFEQHWAGACDPQRHAVPSIVLSDRERDLIDLLAAGHTDVTAAAQLRISSRSVTNVLRSLMDRVGVDNRFQLGLTLGSMRAAAPPPLSDLVAAARPTMAR
jgi:DNA-binding CsgD family transcriptional regulator/biotin operon repressor